jgi:hypothetical protein
MTNPPLPVRTLPINGLRWSGVLAGVAVGIAFYLVFNLGGAALGFSDRNLGNGAAVPLAVAVWSTLSMFASAIVGSYVAARASALRRTADGVLHGVVAWGTTTLVFAVIALTVGGALTGELLGAIAENVRPATAEAVADGAGAISSPAPAIVEAAGRPLGAASAWLAAAIVLSLLAGIAGGMLGAHDARRFVHGTLQPPGDGARATSLTTPGAPPTRHRDARDGTIKS